MGLSLHSRLSSNLDALFHLSVGFLLKIGSTFRTNFPFGGFSNTFGHEFLGNLTTFRSSSFWNYICILFLSSKL
ncbi:hypothetical protein Hanom_Chr03g00265051 [Helianthus anomalus]